MKRETKLLLKRAIDSLLLAIEHFNRPWNRGRAEAVFVFLDHAFEMFLKAAILHTGGKIREKGKKETIGFDHCVRKCLSDAQVKCLTEDQAITLRTINGHRDAAMHYTLEISEPLLYLHTQAGVTLFNDLLSSVFQRSLADLLPKRVLPISTELPSNLIILMNNEFDRVKDLLMPGLRRRTQAKAKLRSLAIIENAINREGEQPDELELNKLLGRIVKGGSWETLFPGVAALQFETEGTGLTVNLRISKTEGFPVKLVKEGELPGAPVVAVRRVSELDYYSLGAKDLARKLGLGMNKTLAIVEYLKIQEDTDYFREIRIGSSQFKRYSKKALELLRGKIQELNMAEVWERYKESHYRVKRKSR